MQDLRERVASGSKILNCWLSIPSPVVAEALARQGFHSVCVDLQHGLIDYSDCLSILQAIGSSGAVPLVRVPSSDPAMIMKVLDAGAQGIIVPLVDSAADAATAVSACRYPPLGNRSYGPTRAAMIGGPDYHRFANERVLVFAMIETATGLRNLEEIVATPGLTGIYIGPADLSYALGLEPRQDNEHPAHMAAVQAITDACRRNGLLVGIHTADPAFARAALERGADMVTIATDLACLKAEANRRLAYFD